jgi:hypothetical protein
MIFYKFLTTTCPAWCFRSRWYVLFHGEYWDATVEYTTSGSSPVLSVSPCIIIPPCHLTLKPAVDTVSSNTLQTSKDLHISELFITVGMSV